MTKLNPDGFRLFPAAYAGEISPQLPIKRETTRALAGDSIRALTHGGLGTVLERDYGPAPGGYFTTSLIPVTLWQWNYRTVTDRPNCVYHAFIENARLTFTTETLGGAPIDVDVQTSAIGLPLQVVSSIVLGPSLDIRCRLEIESLDGNNAFLYFFNAFEGASLP